MDPYSIFEKYYDTSSSFYELLIGHSEKVAARAVKLAENYEGNGNKIDIKLVYQSALLHDIGIINVHIPKINTSPKLPYLCHAYQGADILRNEGYPKHANVAENHIGVGLPKRLIMDLKLPVPVKDYFPTTIEQKIVSYSDLFFSKKSKSERSLTNIISELRSYNNDKYFGVEDHDVKLFMKWHNMFKI